MVMVMFIMGRDHSILDGWMDGTQLGKLIMSGLGDVLDWVVGGDGMMLEVQAMEEGSVRVTSPLDGRT